MATKAAGHTPNQDIPEDFHLFQGPPIELQLHIWTFAADNMLDVAFDISVSIYSLSDWEYLPLPSLHQPVFRLLRPAPQTKGHGRLAGPFGACQGARDTAFDVRAEFREDDYETNKEIEKSVICNRSRWVIRRRAFRDFRRTYDVPSRAEIRTKRLLSV